MPLDQRLIHQTVTQYYEDKLRLYGPTPRGVDWNSESSQRLRFDRLLEALESRANISVLDYGCGYGALLDFLSGSVADFDYYGFDISGQMTAAANRLFGDRPRCRFISGAESPPETDYVLASGIFNVKLDADVAHWEEYLLSTLHEMHDLARVAFAFNCLTKYCDPAKKRPDLYYADPAALVTYCLDHFSPRVSLCHDYPLYEFTIIVRKRE